MIQSWEALGDILAEFENRLSELENSMPNNIQKMHIDNPVKPIINVTYRTTEGKTPGFKALKEEISLLKQKTRKQKHISPYR